MINENHCYEFSMNYFSYNLVTNPLVYFGDGMSLERKTKY